MLGHTHAENERLRAQSRAWEAATSRVRDCCSTTPGATDVSGRLAPLAQTHRMLTAVVTSLLPTAIAHGITTETEAAVTLADFTRDAERSPERPTLWPLMIGGLEGPAA